MKYTIFNMQEQKKLVWLWSQRTLHTASSGDDTPGLLSSHFWGKTHQKRNKFDHRGRSKAIYWPTNLAVTTPKIIPPT